MLWNLKSRKANVKVVVETGTANGLKVRASGITKDLPGGLGGASSSALAGSSSNCLITRSLVPSSLSFEWLRSFRNTLLDNRWGRMLVALYYFM